MGLMNNCHGSQKNISRHENKICPESTTTSRLLICTSRQLGARVLNHGCTRIPRTTINRPSSSRLAYGRMGLGCTVHPHTRDAFCRASNSESQSNGVSQWRHCGREWVAPYSCPQISPLGRPQPRVTIFSSRLLHRESLLVDCIESCPPLPSKNP